MTALIEQLTQQANPTLHQHLPEEDPAIPPRLSIVVCRGEDKDSRHRDDPNDNNTNDDEHDDDNHLHEHRGTDLFLEQLQEDFPDSIIHVLKLGDFNPLSLEEQMDQWRPNIVWVKGTNAFSLRYQLRISGLDRWIENHCAGVFTTTTTSSNEDGSRGSSSTTRASRGCCVYIGEDAGTICAGSSLQVAKQLLQHDPKVSPEPQFFGLGLLGKDKTIAFSNLETQEVLQYIPSRKEDITERGRTLTILRSEQVYVWSQSSNGQEDISVSSFVYLPNQRGMMEQITSPQPLPPLGDHDGYGGTAGEGVACYGEPARDPSRQMQSSTIGDSEWFEG